MPRRHVFGWQKVHGTFQKVPLDLPEVLTLGNKHHRGCSRINNTFPQMPGLTKAPILSQITLVCHPSWEPFTGTIFHGAVRELKMDKLCHVTLQLTSFRVSA